MLLLALATGFAWDARYFVPLGQDSELVFGLTILLYGLAGSFIQGVRPLFRRGRWTEVLEPLDAEWADFLEACRSREAPENDALVGIAAIELVERVRGAIRLQPGSAARDHDPALGR